MDISTSNITYKDSSNWTESDLKLFDLPIEWVVLSTIIMVIVLVLTVLGNIAVIVVFATSDVLRSTVNNHFLVSLAVADLLVGVFVMPCAIDALRTQTWRCGTLMKYFNSFGNFCFCISSIMHLMFLSIDKYFYIANPLKYPNMVTQRRVYISCLTLWLYSGFWALLPLIGVSSYECFIPYIGICAQKDWSTYGLNFAFAISVVSGTYGVALIVMFIVYWKIAKIIRRQTIKIEISAADGNANKTSMMRRYKGVITLIIVIVTYLICWSPFCIILFIEIGKGKKLDRAVSLFGMLIGFSNSCCNPIIYWIKYRYFRRALSRLLTVNFISCSSPENSSDVFTLSKPPENTPYILNRLGSRRNSVDWKLSSM